MAPCERCSIFGILLDVFISINVVSMQPATVRAATQWRSEALTVSRGRDELLDMWNNCDFFGIRCDSVFLNQSFLNHFGLYYDLLCD